MTYSRRKNRSMAILSSQIAYLGLVIQIVFQVILDYHGLVQFTRSLTGW
jgi:hypothetical protein